MLLLLWEDVRWNGIESRGKCLSYARNAMYRNDNVCFLEDKCPVAV